MATIQENLFVLLTLLSSFSLFLNHPSCSGWKEQSLISCNFSAIYQFGDSIMDTGNSHILNPNAGCNHPPYGKSLGSRANGRCSDGFLMIDYITQAAGLPLLEPYHNKEANHSNGVNFAVAGATALPVSILHQKNISTFGDPIPLSEQLDWLSTHLKGTYVPKDGVEKFKRTLFIVGEIGQNDYTFAVGANKTFEEILPLVPEVVQAIKDAVKRVIGYGAVRVLVPGNPPLGCLAGFLALFQTSNSSSYDELHCIKGLNEISKLHNRQLQEAIKGLKREYPKVNIVYGDYYNAFAWLLRNAQQLGFDVVDKRCCGRATKGMLYDPKNVCGLPNVPVCPNPNKRICLDGIHLTQQANKYCANCLIQQIMPDLHCTA